MKHDFLAACSIADEDETCIDQVVNAQQDYKILNQADWTTRSQVLATGLADVEKRFGPFKKGMPTNSLSDLIKNGRYGNRNISSIGGYPEIIKRQRGLPDQTGLNITSFCAPADDCLELLPDGSALVQIEMELTRPFHSRDDQAFYPHENPLKREWVFGKPYLAASGVKGLLRWAWRMIHDNNANHDFDFETTIFGPRSEDMNDDNARQGCLYTWPLFWQGKVGLEVINAQNRDTLAGSTPVKYEVVEDGATAILHILLMNRGMTAREEFIRQTVLPVMDSLHCLLTTGGLSAKRSADWGSVKTISTKICVAGIQDQEEDEKARIAALAAEEAARKTAAQDRNWAEVLDSNGNLKPSDDPVYTASKLSELTGKSKKYVRGKKRDKAFKTLQRLLKERQQQKKGKSAQGCIKPAREETLRRPILRTKLDSLPELQKKLQVWLDKEGTYNE